MKFTLVLLVLFVASTCTSAYFVKRGKGGSGKDGLQKSGGGSGTSDVEKSGPRKICKEVVDSCMKGDEESDSEVTEDAIEKCINKVEEDIAGGARRGLREDLGLCKSALQQCLDEFHDDPLPQDRSLRRALTLMLRAEDLQTCGDFLENLPVDSVDEDDRSMSKVPPPAPPSEQNLRRFLYKMLNEN